MKKIVLIFVALITCLSGFSQMATVAQQTANGVKMDTTNARALSIKKHDDTIRVLLRTLNTRILTLNTSIGTNTAITVTGGATAIRQDTAAARLLSIKKFEDTLRVLLRTLNTRILTLNNTTATNSAVAISSGSITNSAGENYIGFSSHKATKKLQTITTSTATYASGDNIGGIITFTASLRSVAGSAKIQDFFIWDKENQKPNLRVDFWTASPSGTYTDNAAEVIAGDQAKWLGSISIASSDFVTQGAIATAQIKNIGITIFGTSDTTIYCTIAVNGSSSPSYTGGTTQLVSGIGIEQN